jgi:hypothetical protein
MPRTDEEVATINVRVPTRRWSRPYTVTFSDTISDRNLQRNRQPFKYLQNLGTGGLVNIAWEPDGTEVTIGLAQYQFLEGGLWRHAKTTGTTTPGTAVILRGFLGIEGADR